MRAIYSHHNVLKTMVTFVWQASGPAACNEEWEPANTVNEEGNSARHSGGPETPVRLQGGRRKKDKDFKENPEASA
jgi:hypothetical protein